MLHGRGATAESILKLHRALHVPALAGVLFEIATDGPGFTADEPAFALGSRLILPARYEPMRPEIKARWSRLRLPITSASA